jgi:hypothetical protein
MNRDEFPLFHLRWARTACEIQRGGTSIQKRGERESTTKSSAAAIIELFTNFPLKCKQTNKHREMDREEKLKNAKWQVMCSPHSK